jgi:hypothetical protein
LPGGGQAHTVIFGANCPTIADGRLRALLDWRFIATFGGGIGDRYGFVALPILKT